MEIKSSGRWDWWTVPRAWAEAVGLGAPGIDIRRDGHVDVHRTHLPLFAAAGYPVPADTCVDVPENVRGVELRPWQRRFLAWAQPRRGVLVVADPRMGKGQPRSAKVLTPAGWVPIGQLQVGHAVIDPDGGAAVVQGVFPQGVKRVYRVTTSDGAVTECDEDHLWHVQTTTQETRGRPARVFSTAELIARGLRRREKPRARSGINANRWILPLTAPIDFVPQVLPIEPYLLGLLIGDGSFHERLSLSTADREIVDAATAAVAPMGLTLKHDGGDRCDYRISGAPGAGNPLLAAVRALGLDRLAHEKFVPAAYKLASVADRMAILAGLLDTDGYAGGSTEFYTTSPQLRDDVIDLVRSLGGLAWFATKVAPAYTHKGERRTGRPCYVVRMVTSFNPFRLQRKAKAWNPRAKRRRTIASIEHVRDEETVCIKVSSKRSLYITDGYIVTHNTSAALVMHDPSTGPLMIFAPLDVRAVWTAWVRRVFPGASIAHLEGHAPDGRIFREHDVVFAHYDILAWHQVAGIKIGTLIVDEIHMLSNATSRRAEAVRVFTPLARRVITLTGTPLWNRTEGLWPVLAATNPGAWGHRPFSFKQRYCSPQMGEHGWRYGEVSNVEEWRLRIAEVAFTASWKIERPDLQPTIRRRISARVDDADLLRLDEVAEGLRGSDVADTTIGAIARYRSATGMLKVPTVVARTLEVSADEPVVVWAWHKAVIKAVAEATRAAGRPTFLIHGDRTIPAEERVRRIEAWRQEPRGVLCATQAVAQVGIDLSHARHAIKAQTDWTPAVDYQTDMRTFDPNRVMTIERVTTTHPVEVMIDDHGAAKLARAEAAGLPAAGSDFSIDADAWDDGDLLTELHTIAVASAANFAAPVGGV